MRAEENFPSSYRKKTQKIIRQMFSLEMMRPAEEDDLNFSLQTIVKEILLLENQNHEVSKMAVNWCPKQHSRGTAHESGFRGVSMNGNAGW